MRTLLRTVTTTTLLVVLGAPAGAQTPNRVELERQIEDTIREMTRDLEQRLRELDIPSFAQRGPQGRRGGGPPRGPQVTETFSQTVRLGSSGTFDLGGLSGNVIVTGGGGTDVRIDAVKRTRDANDAAGRARLQEVAIEVREQPNRVEVRTRYPENSNGAVAVDFTVTVPQGTSVVLRTVSGDIRASNIRGEVRADTLSGNIEVSQASRIGALKAVSGDITLSDSRADEVTDISTLNGNLIVRKVTARRLDLTSVSGDITLTDAEIEQGMLRTTSGDVTFAGTLARNGRYEISTHSGDIALTVATTGFALEASTFSGDVRSDYAMSIGNGGGGGGRGPRRGPGQLIRGTFGDGGAILALRSFNGDISISRRQ